MTRKEKKQATEARIKEEGKRIAIGMVQQGKYLVYKGSNFIQAFKGSMDWGAVQIHNMSINKPCDRHIHLRIAREAEKFYGNGCLRGRLIKQDIPGYRSGHLSAGPGKLRSKELAAKERQGKQV